MLFWSKDRNSITKVFITYSHPLVEYASWIWSSSTVILISKISAVEKRFTKTLLDLNFLEYHKRLAILGHESLELWIFFKLISAWHKKSCLLILILTLAIVFSNRINKTTRGQPFTLVKPLCRVRARSDIVACSVKCFDQSKYKC